jgi:anaerobic magnesium-protoporphyrin IX monomethyl ester cyclase
MKILLVAPTVDTCYERVPNMGLMNLYLVGKALECDMELMDLTELPYRDGLRRILKREYDVIGVSCNFTNAAPYCMQYAKDIKDRCPNTTVISGGNHATLVPEDLLFHGYDYVISGEGEATFREFLQRLLNRESMHNLRGICYLREGNIIKNPARQAIEDLDTLPFNDYSYFDLEPYFKRSGLRYISMETSRGCIYNCTFCSTVKMWGHEYRHKSPQRIVEEFKIAKKLNLDFVFIEDDDTALDEQSLCDFCRLLIQENAIVPWGMGIGSASIKDESTFDLIAKSGCIKVNVNIESANSRILREYRKPYSIEDNKRLCDNLRKRKILIHNHGIIGLSDETIRESLNTYFYLIKTSPVWHISVLEPRPGSDYWEKWDKQGDTSQYKLFGKAEVILGKQKAAAYLIYRIFALFYFFNPIRVWKALFERTKGIRYSYRVQYYVAYRTLKVNFLNFFQTILNFKKKLALYNRYP